MAKCNCDGCSRVGTHRISVDRRGGRNAYLCDYHFRYNNPYGTGNNIVTGTIKQNGVYIGAEFELAEADLKGRMEFTAMGTQPTNDSSLCGASTVEFVFPTMRGLNKLSKDARSIEKLMAGGHIGMNDSCGTHLHVSTQGTRSENGMDYVRRFYNSLFVPLTEAMQANPEATERLFGRYFTGYAPAIDMSTPCRAGHNGTRYAWVNCTNSNRIEYRLVKFQNAEQYIKVVKLCIEMTKCIDKNFIEHFNDTPKDSNRYPTQTAYRKHKAQMTAQKLVDKFLKAIAE